MAPDYTFHACLNYMHSSNLGEKGTADRMAQRAHRYENAGKKSVEMR